MQVLKNNDPSCPMCRDSGFVLAVSKKDITIETNFMCQCEKGERWVKSFLADKNIKFVIWGSYMLDQWHPVFYMHDKQLELSIRFDALFAEYMKNRFEKRPWTLSKNSSC